MSSKLFVFSRPLPAPFDKAKKKVKVSSKYGNGTEATLCSTVVKAVQAYFKCKDGSAPGAVGLCGTKGVAEYKSASGPEVYHLAIYDPAGGAMLASIYNKDTEMLETYAVRNNGQDGAAIMMSMLPALMADDEFRENLETSGSGWFALDELPELDLEKTTPEQLEMCFQADRARHWETRLE